MSRRFAPLMAAHPLSAGRIFSVRRVDVPRLDGRAEYRVCFHTPLGAGCVYVETSAWARHGPGAPPETGVVVAVMHDLVQIGAAHYTRIDAPIDAYETRYGEMSFVGAPADPAALQLEVRPRG